MFNLNRNTKIFLSVFAALILLGIVSFFILKKPISTSPEESTSQNKPPSTLPSSSTPVPIQKSFPANGYNLQKQEADSYDALKSDPNLIASIQNTKSDLKLDGLGTSFPSAAAKLKNGDEILILSGCEPHNCGGTEKIIAYDKKAKKSYIFIEKYGSAVGYEILGNPSEEIRNLLIFYYKNK